MVQFAGDKLSPPRESPLIFALTVLIGLESSAADRILAG
jgi:hypothetical protein